MLDTTSADKLITKGGKEVLFVTHLPFSKSADNEYAVQLVENEEVFLYSKDGKCTEAAGVVEDITQFDLILK